MISRVAESCFWLHRYVERVDNTARMLEVNQSYELDSQLRPLERWRPLLIVAGEDPSFRRRHGPEAAGDGELVQEYLVWSRRSVASVFNSARMARENARTTRETISLEMWRTINGFWLWLSDRAGRRAFRTDRADFYARLKESAQLFRGISHDTMMHDEAYQFMRLGMLLERAGQTARSLDVKHHLLGPTDPAEGESPEEFAHWIAILRTCSATDSFSKRGTAFSGSALAGFLLFEDGFPRSVHHCLREAARAVEMIREDGGGLRGERSADLLGALLARLQTHSVREVLGSGIHDELTFLINGIAAVCDQVHGDFFDPTLAEADLRSRLGRSMAQ